MPYYQSRGELPPKRYTVLRRPKGEIYHEELLGTEGFVGESSTLYHLNPPTRVTRIEPVPGPELKISDGPSENLLFEPDQLDASGEFSAARVPLFVGDDVIYSVSHPDREPEGFYRNGFSDELVIVVEGAGELVTAFGCLEYEPFDLVVVPRGVTSRWVPRGTQRLIVIETRTPLVVPQRYRSPAGQLLDSAPFHERDLRTPILEDPIDGEGEFPVVIKTGSRMDRYVFDRHPFDVVGWDGFFYPYKINMRDLEPISGIIHPNPDQYQVFESEGVAICCLVPHPGASHPDASPAQAHHMNLDYDEVLHRFSTAGGSRDPRGGSVTLHPRALAHGPKPGYEQAKPPSYIKLWGVIVDTRRQLNPTMAAMGISDERYAANWL